MAYHPPGGPAQIVFSFDTTGSMSSILDEVRGRLTDMIGRLQADIPGIQIAVFAHGDYCDEREFYVTKHIDFTDNVNDLFQFVSDVGGTGGGDTDECYELVLRQVQGLSWQENSQKSLVLIGDAGPHAPDYPLNVDNINWQQETQNLAAKGVKIYAVQCLNEPGVEIFYEGLADITAGRHLKLNQFSNIFDFLMAICYREKGAEFLHGYEAEVRARTSQTSLNKDLEGLFGALRAPVPAPLSPVVSMDADPAPAPAPAPVPDYVVAANHRPAALVRPRVAKPRRIAKPSQIKRHDDIKLKRLNRASVPQSNFLFNDLTWSPWKLVISGNTDSLPQWRKRNGTSTYRRRLAFSETHRRAIYEFSLQDRKGAKRRVVFFKVIEGFESPERWETKLLRDFCIRSEINDVVSDGCEVFVRRALLKRSQSVRSCRSKLRNLYNYEWIKTKSEREREA
ncbi:uncharacterized protein LOC135469159 [Liolophura sinensis]|uniref:uncharacterized protein LOC135469159 n=1 Tax=Liolophura sinensis TaxID=3198878 RepID=UPI0031588EBE